MSYVQEKSTETMNLLKQYEATIVAGQRPRIVPCYQSGPASYIGRTQPKF